MAYLILILAVAGIALLAVETMMPGFGVAGISGLCVELAAIVLAGINFGLTAALLLVALVVIAGGASIWLSLRSIRSGRLSHSGLVLNSTESGTPADSLQAMEGQVGVVVAALRPVGVADFKGDRYEVRAEGEFITTGTEVRVIRVEGNKMTVRPV